MTPEELIAFLGRIEPLKTNTRHSWTAGGAHETVAAHSWRVAVMALLLRREFPGVDMDKVTAMALIHDFGEAVTGDIPAFEKTDGHRAVEEREVHQLVDELPEELREEFHRLFREIEAKETPEARLCKALDQLEAVLSHNEADISTWLPLEYELQQVYGKESAAAFPFTRDLQDVLKGDARRKAEEEGNRAGEKMLTHLRLRLIPADPTLAESVAEYYRRNRSFLQPFEPEREEDFFTAAHQRTLLEQEAEAARRKAAYRFYIQLLEEPERIIGAIGLSNVVWGAFRSAFLGYKLDSAYCGQGYMTEAVALLTKYGFQQLGLHRIEANVMPRNKASLQVLRNNGFEEEGVAKAYLRINGIWEDHIHMVKRSEFTPCPDQNRA